MAGDGSREAEPEARDSGTDVDGEAAYDAEEPHAEWLLWVAAIVIALGAGLLIAPPDLVPELVVGLGPFLVLLGVVGWLGQWLFRRYR